MRSITIRGVVVAASIAVVVLGYGFAPQLHAQQGALTVDPRLAAKGDWDSGTTYAKDDIVTTRGSTWISLRANNLNKVPGQTQPSTAVYWQLFARGFNPLGAWSNVTKYQPDDLVTQNGQTYRAKLTNTNRPTTNTTFWEVLAAKGAAGPNTGVPAGSQSVPAISFSGDGDTGIYSPGAGKIALVENGAVFLHNKGQDNTALGVSALRDNTTGVSNTALGSFALPLNTTGHSNTAIGTAALNSNTGGYANTAVGAFALVSNDSGISNTAVGLNALASNVNGAENIAIGVQPLFSGALASFNVAIGRNALFNSLYGMNNVAIGNYAMENTAGGNASEGIDNTAVGINALHANTTGNGNIALGKDAGSVPTNPANSIFIGNAGGPDDTNTIKIGTQGTQGNAFMAGIAGIAVANSATVLINTSTGQLGTVVSSRRYKEDIASMPDMSVMLAKLRPVTFRYKKEYVAGEKPIEYGLIAEEVAEVFPDLAVFKDGQPETVKYHLLPSFLLAGWQAQQHTIAALHDEVRQQKQANVSLEARLAKLEAALSQTRAAVLRQ